MRRLHSICVGAAVAALLLASGPVSGQAPVGGQAPVQSDVVDRVVAVVGDSVVLMSQVLEEIERMRFQPGFTAPTDQAGYDQLFGEVLDQWVDLVMILQAAGQDSLIQVDEARIDQIVSEEIDTRSQSMGGQPALQQALVAEGLTLAQYREILASQVRQRQVQQLFIQRRLQDASPVEVSENEMLEAFQAARGSLQQRPKLISFEQVVLRPEPSDSAQTAARRMADSVLARARVGEDFAALAREFSDDPGSAEQGGALGWFRPGRMVRAFDTTAFALPLNQISDPVETEFGYHIIRIERERGGERNGRHILISPDLGEADLARTRELAAAVAQRARAGESMAALHDEFSDPLAPDSLTVTLEQLGELPPGYEALQLVGTGDVVGPIEYEPVAGETRIAVVRVREVREAGAYTFEDLRADLATQLQQRKKLERILEELRDRTHIEIRM